LHLDLGTTHDSFTGIAPFGRIDAHNRITGNIVRIEYRNSAAILETVQETLQGMRVITRTCGWRRWTRRRGDIFTYVPNSEIRGLTAYFSAHDYTIEYDYRFRTNNFGLVQDADLVPGQDSLLLLGDSFTEGQGADPWFRLARPAIEKLGYQAVNGGVIGTGFEQWLRLEQYLSAQDIRVRKLLVLFISDDYHRAVWNVQPPVRDCLSDISHCDLNQSLFYRLPPIQQLASWIATIRAARMPPAKKVSLESRARTLLPASYQVYDALNRRLRAPKASPQEERPQEERSHAAIATLIRIYGPQNVAFLHLPQKDEAAGPWEEGLRARRAIEGTGGKLYDGFKLCGLTPADYYRIDSHPNHNGYAKIAACAVDVINQLATR
jgi:hypothetical protein